MKTAIIAGVLAIVCLGGAYVGAPMLMPPAAAAADAAHGAGATKDAPARTAAAHAAPADTTAEAAHAEPSDTAHAAPPAGAGRSRDLLAAAARVRAAEQEILALESQQADLTARLAAARATRDRAAGLAETIVALAPDARRAVLRDLDAEALGYLYGSAPNAVRTALLDGLPPADAARLVGLLAGPAATSGSADPRLHVGDAHGDEPAPAATAPAHHAP